MLRQFFGRRLAAEFLLQLALRAHQLVDGLDHVDRDANGPRLVRDGPRDRLPHPPGGVGRELVSAAVIELVDGLHQADVAFLDQVQERQPAIGVALGDGDHQPEVGLDQLLLRRLGFLLAALDDLQRAPQFGGSSRPLSSSSCWISWLKCRSSFLRSRLAVPPALSRFFHLPLHACDFPFERPQFVDRLAQSSRPGSAGLGRELDRRG